jgi:hypothetical protein
MNTVYRNEFTILRIKEKKSRGIGLFVEGSYDCFSVYLME